MLQKNVKKYVNGLVGTCFKEDHFCFMLYKSFTLMLLGIKLPIAHDVICFLNGWPQIPLQLIENQLKYFLIQLTVVLTGLGKERRKYEEKRDIQNFVCTFDFIIMKMNIFITCKEGLKFTLFAICDLM